MKESTNMAEGEIEETQSVPKNQSNPRTLNHLPMADFDPSYGAPPSWLFGTSSSAALQQTLGPYAAIDTTGTVYYNMPGGLIGGEGSGDAAVQLAPSSTGAALGNESADSLLTDQLHGVSNLNPEATEFVPASFAFNGNVQSQPESYAQPSSNSFSRNRRGNRNKINNAHWQSAKTEVVAQPEEPSYNNLRDRLCEELSTGTYECMICCQPVLRTQHIWSCDKCYHVFHFHSRIALSCISKWAIKGCEDDGKAWRCPGCQTNYTDVPEKYYCFCGKEANPAVPRRGEGTPHSCGRTCSKIRAKNCPHRCTEGCHPGPCPPCPITIKVHCDCGAESKTVRCGTVDGFKCDNVCVRTLSCGAHPCLRPCHDGPCSDCTEMIEQVCHCGGATRSVRCTADSRQAVGYSCGGVCDHLLPCGLHKCERLCHEDNCGQCPKEPQSITRCACGKSALGDLQPPVAERQNCADPVPTCGRPCGKELRCGPRENPHTCPSMCHEGACPPCPKSTPMRCRCGASTKLVPCDELGTYLNGIDDLPVLCERRCKKMKRCKQHRCMQTCCVDQEHICLQICGKRLSCNLHPCDQLCHTGRCPRCLQSSFDELPCRCGKTVLHPPVACGSEPPKCEWPCDREHACDHPVTHTCHNEGECPPCAVLTSKMCHGEHELRNNIPCYIKTVSCGRACNLPLPCNVHKCQKMCHEGPCFDTPFICTQSCQIARKMCGHPCGAQCHVGRGCPDEKCRAKVSVTCKCSRLKQLALCHEVDRMHEKLKVTERAAATSAGATTTVLSRASNRLACIQCDSDCALAQRNANLAAALGIDSNKTSESAPVVYTDFLKEQVRKSLAFVQQVERIFGQLCADLDRLKIPSKSHSFTPMNRTQRTIVHELACYYQIETTSYDREPQRNIVATAARGKSKAPQPILSSMVNGNSGGAGLRPSSSTGGMRALAISNKVVATRHNASRF